MSELVAAGTAQTTAAELLVAHALAAGNVAPQPHADFGCSAMQVTTLYRSVELTFQLYSDKVPMLWQQTTRVLCSWSLTLSLWHMPSQLGECPKCGRPSQRLIHVKMGIVNGVCLENGEFACNGR